MVKNKDYTFAQVLAKKKEIGYIFLGVGLALFLLNITSFITFVVTKSYPYILFDISVFSSILVIVYAIYEIHNSK